MKLSQRRQRILRRAIKDGATFIARVSVHTRGDRTVAYTCPAVPPELALAGYLCGYCGSGEVLPKKGVRCSNCGAIVCDVLRVVDPHEARRIERTLMEMWDRSLQRRKT